MSIEHAKTEKEKSRRLAKAEKEKTRLLEDYWKWPEEWAEAINKAARTVQRHRRLGRGPRLTWIGNSAYVSPESGRAYILSNTETAA